VFENDTVEMVPDLFYLNYVGCKGDMYKTTGFLPYQVLSELCGM